LRQFWREVARIQILNFPVWREKQEHFGSRLAALKLWWKNAA